MDVELLHIEPSAIELNLEELPSFLSQGQEEIDAYTLELLHKLKKQCIERAAPEAGLIYLASHEAPTRGCIKAGKSSFDVGGTIAKMLRGSERYAFFIATCGPGPEELSKNFLREGAYLEGYIVDLIASSLAEGTAEKIHEEIREKALASGDLITNRYSPGYCGWKVDEQQKLFSLFPPDCCGIHLSPTSLMSPIKSVSGLAGIGKAVNFRDYTCELCSMKDCIYRRTKQA